MASYWTPHDIDADSLSKSDHGDYDGSAHNEFEGPYPLEFLPVQDIFSAGLGYLETQAVSLTYDPTLDAFLDLAESTISVVTYEGELNFHKFLLLSAELRLKVYTAYLDDVRTGDELCKHLHTDRFNQPCCIWTWPSELIVCDRHSGSELPTAKYAPWLRALALQTSRCWVR